MKLWLKSNWVSLAVLLMLALAIAFTVSCKTFKPIELEGQPKECEDFYTTMSYYSSMGSADSAFVGTVYNECKTARASERRALREKHCKEMFFGAVEIDKREYEKYVQYLECSK